MAAGFGNPKNGPETPRLPMMAPTSKNEDFVGYDTYMEPFIGWRAWNVVIEEEDKVRLRSITYQVLWEPEKEQVAHCIPTPWNKKVDIIHTSPHKDCGCGIYSVTDKEKAMGWHAWGIEQRLRQRVLGEVKLWGVVFKYTRGYLAQYAYPKSLLVPHETVDYFPLDSKEIVHELRKEYRGVEVKLL